MAHKSSRLHRLLTCLETGLTSATRRTAARQIGESARLHPGELRPLLRRLSTILEQRTNVHAENCFRFEGLPRKKQICLKEPIPRPYILSKLGNNTKYCSQAPTFTLDALNGAKLLTLNNERRDSFPFAVRGLTTQTALLARQRSTNEADSEGGLARQEDPFDSITDKIPEKPVTVAEGASYSVVILIGLAIAGTAAYAVFKELIFEPKEYKVFGKALDRVQHDNQVSARLGAPITGYGQESRNRAARQRISNRTWTDEVGIERIEVLFHIRGPGGSGKVYSEMFKDPEDKAWKYTYLIVDILSPYPTRLMLESYVPPLAPLNAL